MQRPIGVIAIVGCAVLLVWLMSDHGSGRADTAIAPRRALLPFAGDRAVGPRPTRTPTQRPTPWPTPSSEPSLTSSSTPSTGPSRTPWPTGRAVPPASIEITGVRCRGRHEIVWIANAGSSGVDLGNWRLQSVVGAQEFRLPAVALEPGAVLGIHSGPEAPPTDGDIIRWTRAYRWNDAGDEARLVDPEGDRHATRTCDDVPAGMLARTHHP